MSWTNPKFPSFRRNSAVCFHTKIGYHYLKLNQRTQSASFCWILCVKVLSENWRAQMYPPLRTILTNQKKSRRSTKLKLRVLKRLKTTVTWGQCAKLLITTLDQELKWFLLRPKILQLGVVVTHSICEKRALYCNGFWKRPYKILSKCSFRNETGAFVSRSPHVLGMQGHANSGKVIENEYLFPVISFESEWRTIITSSRAGPFLFLFRRPPSHHYYK